MDGLPSCSSPGRRATSLYALNILAHRVPTSSFIIIHLRQFMHIAEETHHRLFRTDKPVGMLLFPTMDVIAFAGFIAV